MKQIATVLLFSIIVQLLFFSCVHHPSKSSEKYTETFKKKIERYDSKDDIVLIKYIWDLKTDTLKINKSDFSNEEIPIIIPGTNTHNFLNLYKIFDGEKIGMDSTACGYGEFLTAKIKNSKGEYLLKNWGCHYNRTIVLKIK